MDSVHMELGEIYDLHCHKGIRIPTFDLAIRWLVHIFVETASHFGSNIF